MVYVTFVEHNLKNPNKFKEQDLTLFRDWNVLSTIYNNEEVKMLAYAVMAINSTSFVQVQISSYSYSYMYWLTWKNATHEVVYIRWGHFWDTHIEVTLNTSIWHLEAPNTPLGPLTDQFKAFTKR